jgi:hypothetical protein
VTKQCSAEFTGNSAESAPNRRPKPDVLVRMGDLEWLVDADEAGELALFVPMSYGVDGQPTIRIPAVGELCVRR